MTTGTSSGTCVITGAGGGMGTALATLLASRGYRLALLDAAHQEIDALASSLNRERDGSAVAVRCDVTDEHSVKRAVRTAHDFLSQIGGLVTCAGSYAPPAPTEALTLDAWTRTIASNLTGTFLVIREILGGMKERRGGRIVTVASNAGRSTATALGPDYTAAKAGVLGLTRHVAREAAPYGVRVNCVAPGPTSGRRLSSLAGEAGLSDIASTIPLGRLADPAEIAAVIAFLLSDDASYVTGATYDVNGGLLMM